MLISVIVTTWGCERWIEECRASVREAVERLKCFNAEQQRGEEQKWQVEVVEICDGTNVANARNRGIAKAQGEWMVFVDGDDVVSPEFFRLVAENGSDAELIRFKLAKFWGGEDWRTMDGEDAFPNYWPACAYRRSVLSECGFSSYRMGEDRLFFLQCINRAKKITNVDAVAYGYRQHDDSTTHRKVTRERWLDRMAAARAWLRESGRSCESVENAEELAAEIAKARRVVAWDVVGVAALELQFLGGRHWDDWQKNLDDVAALGKVVPLIARVQVSICRTFRWRWVTRLVAEWPRRILMHYGR